ncbi:MAG: hypothetical protein NT150_01495 [Bacteroidetes bacterium]|nr:hypothetical protein [Bacteroidota bacterium]
MGRIGFTLQNPLKATDIADMAMLIDYNRDDPFYAGRKIEPKDRHKSIKGQFEMQLEKQGLSGEQSGDLGDVFRHMLIQGLVADAYGEGVAKTFGDAFERGKTGTHGVTTGDDSYGDLINNAWGREYLKQYKKDGGSLDNIEGFTNFVNFMAKKSLNADEAAKGKMVKFTKDDEVIKKLFKEFKQAKSGIPDMAFPKG